MLLPPLSHFPYFSRFPVSGQYHFHTHKMIKHVRAAALHLHVQAYHVAFCHPLPYELVFFHLADFSATDLALSHTVLPLVLSISLVLSLLLSPFRHSVLTPHYTLNLLETSLASLTPFLGAFSFHLPSQRLH